MIATPPTYRLPAVIVGTLGRGVVPLSCTACACIGTLRDPTENTPIGWLVLVADPDCPRHAAPGPAQITTGKGPESRST